MIGRLVTIETPLTAIMKHYTESATVINTCKSIPCPQTALVTSWYPSTSISGMLNTSAFSISLEVCISKLMNYIYVILYYQVRFVLYNYVMWAFKILK